MKVDAPRGSQSTCLCVWQMEASVQTPVAGGVSTYFTRIQRRDDIHCKVQEKKHKYLSDLKDVLVPAFQLYVILLILIMGSVSISVSIQQPACHLCLMGLNGPQRQFAQVPTGHLFAIIILEPLYGAAFAGCA